MAKIRHLPRGQRHNYIQAVFFVLLLGLSIYILLQSPFFNVRKIEIVGRNEITQQELVQRSGISLGANIFKLDLKVGEEKIKLLPEVKSVKLTRKFPSTIVIDVMERQAVAFLPVDNGFVEVDNEGKCIRQGKIEDKHVPIITGININEIKPGQRIDNPRVELAIQVITQLPLELVNILSEIHVDHQHRVIIYTIHGVQGRLGYPDEISQKGNMFLQVLGQMRDSQQIEYIDLTSFKAPVVKYTRTPEGVSE